MGGNYNIMLQFFRVLGGRILGDIWGELGEKAVERPYKALQNVIFH